MISAGRYFRVIDAPFSLIEDAAAATGIPLDAFEMNRGYDRIPNAIGQKRTVGANAVESGGITGGMLERHGIANFFNQLELETDIAQKRLDNLTNESCPCPRGI